jgi:hypothetical protein
MSDPFVVLKTLRPLPARLGANLKQRPGCWFSVHFNELTFWPRSRSPSTRFEMSLPVPRARDRPPTG